MNARRAIAGAAVVGTLAAGGFLIGRKAETTAAATAAEPSPAARRPVPRFAGAPPAPPTFDAEGGPPLAVRQRLDRARRRLRDAARPCFADRKQPAGAWDRDETVQELALRYRLTSSGDHDRVTDLRVTASTVSDSAVEACILAALRAARWPGGGDDLPIADRLRLGELAAPAEPAALAAESPGEP